MGQLAPGIMVILVVCVAGLAAGLSTGAIVVASTACLCALWWTTQPIHIGATSLIPFVVLPAAGVLDASQAAGAFGHKLILLLLGGFLLSTLMEKSGAHQQLALRVVNLFRATTGPRAIAAFAATSCLLSMWISNTATTLMLLPIALAIIGTSSHPTKLAGPLLLAMAWGANIGGMGTPVGTPPNPLLMAELEKMGVDWGFVDFMALGLPIIAILLPTMACMLAWGVRDVQVTPPEQTPWNTTQLRAFGLFCTTALLWVTRTAPYGGWSDALGWDQVGDHTVALGMVVLAFLLPDGRGQKMLDWKTASNIPWALLLLFSGGLALGQGFRSSGLDASLAALFTATEGWAPSVVVLTITTVVAMATELLSNTATAALLLPVLRQAATDAGTDPTPWLAAATLAASCAFIMPVATAPNAIVFGTGKVDARQMFRLGLMLNIMAAFIITGVILALV